MRRDSFVFKYCRDVRHSGAWINKVSFKQRSFAGGMIMDKASLYRQHNEIMEITGKIGQLALNERQAAANAQEISLLLAQLAGKLKNHLLIEDQFVYPRLQGHQDNMVQEISNRFFTEMGGLVSVFEAFKQRFRGASKIVADPADFIAGFKMVAAGLAERIGKENDQLYSLLDQ